MLWRLHWLWRLAVAFTFIGWKVNLVTFATSVCIRFSSSEPFWRLPFSMSLASSPNSHSLRLYRSLLRYINNQVTLSDVAAVQNRVRSEFTKNAALTKKKDIAVAHAKAEAFLANKAVK